MKDKAFIVTKESVGGYSVETFLVVATDFAAAESAVYATHGYAGSIKEISVWNSK